MLDAAVAQAHRGTTGVGIAQFEQPPVETFQQSEDRQAEAEDHAVAVQVLEQDGLVPVDQVVGRAKVLAHEEAQHGPTQGHRSGDRCRQRTTANTKAARV